MNSDTPDPPVHPPTWTRIPPGTRVVVRRRLSQPEAAAARVARRGAIWTDIIGFLLVASGDGLRVRTDPRPGREKPAEIDVPADQIESVKPVPPRPERVVRRPGPPR